MSAANPASKDVHVHGHCYCGGIEFEVQIQAGQRPIFTAYCHCDSCRRAHSAPLYHVVALDTDMMKITKGADLLVEFQKPDANIVRAFCSTCGSKILNRFPGWRPGGREPVAMFPSTLDESAQHPLAQVFHPCKHNQPDEHVLDADMLRSFFDAH